MTRFKNNNNSKHFYERYLSLIIVIVSATSCYHVYYAPNTVNAPLLSEKGEVRVNGLYSGGGDSDFDGGELQAATAITNHVGIMMNGMFAGRTEHVEDWFGGSGSHLESGKGSYGEIGGGLFTAFDPKKKCIGEIYAGVGTGSINNTYQNNWNSKVGITKIFLQPTVGFKSKYFEASLVPKISFLHWKVKNENISNTAGAFEFDDLMKIRQNPNLVQFEPALFIRGGGENLKLQGSLSFSSSHNGYYPIETLNGSVGVSINIKPKKK
jgi:hypothetical protein